MNSNKNRKKIVIVIGILAIILVIGISYAWLKTTIQGEKEYVIRAGDLDVILNETSNGLSIDNAIPVEDSIGLQSEGATFSIVNNSSTNGVCYEIYLDDMDLSDGDVRVDDKFIKYSLDRDDEIGTAQVLTNAGSNPNRIIDSYEIKPGKTITYKLRLWFNAEEDGMYAGQVFKGKLRVEATQCLVKSVMRSYAAIVDGNGNYVEQVDYHADEYREKITSIETKADINIPTTALSVTNGKGNYWDVSEDQDGSVIAYIEEDGTGNGTYKLTIGENGGVVANRDSSRLFRNFGTLINLDLSNFDTSTATNMKAMFTGCDNLIELNISCFDTSKVIDMSSMFSKCNSLTTLDLSNFNTLNVVNMSGMFSECNSLRDLDISNFNTANVTDMYVMFYKCSGLITLNLSGFDTSHVKTMRSTFSECSSLKDLDISNFNTTNVTDMFAMFYNCNSLVTLTLTNFDTSSVITMENMFCKCSNLTSIIVSDKWTITENINIKDMFLNCGCDHVTVI